MLQLQDLSVGLVSGMIAAAVFMGMLKVESSAWSPLLNPGNNCILSTTSSAIHSYNPPGHSSRTPKGEELHCHRLRSYVVCRSSLSKVW
jgi:hypothetical protein